VSISPYVWNLSFRVPGVGIDVFHPLSIHECSTERGGCLRT
jgi:hypothetical protein